VDVAAAFVAGSQPLEGMQPGEAALDHPAVAAQTGAVGDAATSNAWSDAAGAQDPPVPVVVVAAIGVDLARLAARSSAPAADRRHGVE
jgi:hypothetical protein